MQYAIYKRGIKNSYHVLLGFSADSEYDAVNRFAEEGRVNWPNNDLLLVEGRIIDASYGDKEFKASKARKPAKP